jgi:hypothetical protein
MNFVSHDFFSAMIIRFVVGALSIDVLGEHTALVFRLEKYGIHVPETRLLLSDSQTQYTTLRT